MFTHLLSNLSMFTAPCTQTEYYYQSFMFAQPKLCGIDVSMTGLKTFSLSELYAAINDKNIIGTGSSCKVYKVLTKI